MVDGCPPRSAVFRTEMESHTARVVDRVYEQRMHDEDVASRTGRFRHCAQPAACEGLLDEGANASMVAHAPLACVMKPAGNSVVRPLEERSPSATRCDRGDHRENDHRLVRIDSPCVAVNVPPPARCVPSFSSLHDWVANMDPSHAASGAVHPPPPVMTSVEVVENLT